MNRANQVQALGYLLRIEAMGSNKILVRRPDAHGPSFEQIRISQDDGP